MEGRGENNGSEKKNSWIPYSGLAAVLAVTGLILAFAVVYGFTTAAGGDAQAGMTQSTDATGTSASGTAGTETDGTDPANGAEELALMIAEQADKLDALTRLRSDIIAGIIAESSELELEIDIDETTGAVRFNEALFFQKNSEQINEAGQQYLRSFIPVYLSTVINMAGDDLDNIIIEGHADEDGTYLYNLNLSQRRAYAVAAFIFDNGLTNVQGIANPEKMISISGRSYSAPVVIDGAVDRERSRRVEFIFRLKDEDAINGLKTLFDSFQLERAAN